MKRKQENIPEIENEGSLASTSMVLEVLHASVKRYVFPVSYDVGKWVRKALMLTSAEKVDPQIMII